MRFLIVLALAINVTILRSQIKPYAQKFSASDLKQDLQFLKKQIYDVHVSPFTEIKKIEYDQLFENINSKLNDSISVKDFYTLIRPLVAYLADEHARLNFVDLGIDVKTKSVLLPFTLIKSSSNYLIDSVLVENSGIKKGDTLTAINNKAINNIMSSCSNLTSGFKEQREKIALSKFGLLCFFEFTLSATYSLTINHTKRTIDGCSGDTWVAFLSNKNQYKQDTQLIEYLKYGNTAYLKTNSFNASETKLPTIKEAIMAIFKAIQNDKCQTLVVDVSNNSGGNSMVGNFIIDYITSKPYKEYQCNWKKSEEYQNFMSSIPYSNDTYSATKTGEIIHFDSEFIKPTKNNPYRFTGKVFVLIGEKTFSSAIQFATVIKDNHIAKLAGTKPENGHPTHFGEVYSTQLPQTKLSLQFGVKEWIRPIGKGVDNYLVPDIIIDLEKENTPNKIINFLTK